MLCVFRNNFINFLRIIFELKLYRPTKHRTSAPTPVLFWSLMINQRLGK